MIGQGNNTTGKRDRFVDGDRIVELEPVGGYGNEPDVDEWFALPTGPPCPSCGSTWWGSSNCRGILLTRHCHDEFGIGCRTRFRTGDKRELGIIAADAFGVFCGYRRRYWIGRYPQHAYVLDDGAAA